MMMDEKVSCHLSVSSSEASEMVKRKLIKIDEGKKMIFS